MWRVAEDALARCGCGEDASMDAAVAWREEKAKESKVKGERGMFERRRRAWGREESTAWTWNGRKGRECVGRGRAVRARTVRTAGRRWESVIGVDHVES